MKISASILACNFANVEKELNKVEGKVDYLHIDIMDGHFVSNISFGPYVTKCISKKTKLPLDIHLMIDEPLKFIDEFIVLNPAIITVHYETIDKIILEKIAKKLKGTNIKLGLSIKPNTPYEVLIQYLDLIDVILIMSVEPGFCGQKFNDEVIYKIDRLKEIQETNNNFLIQVDGGINNTTIGLVKKADIAVLGSYIFNSKNLSNDINIIKG